MIIQLFVPYLLAVRKTEEWMISQMSFSGAILWINIFSSVLLVPVYEEIVFRGCLLTLLNSGLMTIFTPLLL